MELLFTAIIGPVVASILFAVVLWVWNFPSLVKEMRQQNESAVKKNEDLARLITALESAVRELIQSNEANSARHDVHDRVISDLLDFPYDSEVIAKDGMRYPKISRKRVFSSDEN